MMMNARHSFLYLFKFLTLAILFSSSLQSYPSILCLGDECVNISCQSEARSGNWTGVYNKKFGQAFVSYNDGYFKDEITIFNLTYQGEGKFIGTTPNRTNILIEDLWSCRV